MKLVACTPENIPPWIFPEVESEYPDKGSAVEIPLMTVDSLEALLKTLKSSEPTLTYEDSGCDVGFPHDAPESVLRFRSSHVELLISIPLHERWKFAEQWAQSVKNGRPNKDDLKQYKKLFNIICDHALVANVSGYALIIVEPYNT